MPATAFHLSVVPMSRSTGKSSVAKAAYITGGKLADERTGKLHDYTRRGGVEAVLHAQLKDAPEWSRDVAQAWNAVEAVENRRNSQTAKVIDGLAFPHGIDAEARKRMLTDFMREQFGRKGLLWTASIHAPDKDGDQRNYHAHVMWSERPLTADGFAKNKDRSGTAYDTREAALVAMRERWAALSAKQLERAGLPLEAERWKHAHLKLEEQRAAAIQRGDNTYAEQLTDREPTKHLGRATVALERKGIATERGGAWEATEARNDARQALRQQAAALVREETRLAAKDERAAAYAASHAKTEPETIRLYRGIGNNVTLDGSLNLDGVFFSTNKDRAAAFGTLHFVDVSREELKRYKCPHSAHVLLHEPAAKDDYRIADPAILGRLRPLATEHQRSQRAAKLAGLEDVQTLRGLWRSADTAQTFLKAAQIEGFRLARVTERDAAQSKAEAEATASRNAGRRAPHYGAGDLIAYNRQGYGLRLDGATLDDDKAHDRMAQAAAKPLPSLAEVRQAVLEDWKAQQAAYRRETRAEQLGDRAHVQAIRLQWRSAESPQAFIKGLREQGYTVARVSQQCALQSQVDAVAAEKLPAKERPSVYRQGELLAMTHHGQTFRLDGATLADARAPQRLTQTAQTPLPTFQQARRAIEQGKADRQAERDTRAQAAPQSRARAPQGKALGMARAAFSGLVEYLFGWLGDRKPRQQRGKAEAPRRNLATEAREASKRADKSLAGARDIEANYGHRLLQLDPEIQDSLRRAREAEQRRRDDDERERER